MTDSPGFWISLLYKHLMHFFVHEADFINHFHIATPWVQEQSLIMIVKTIIDVHPLAVHSDDV